MSHRMDRPHEHLLQRHGHDCGVACAAMLLRCSYEEAVRLFVAQGLDQTRRNLPAWSSQVGELENVLRAAGIRVGRQRFTAWHALQTPVIAKTQVRSSGWHWVVIERTAANGLTVLDPWPGVDPCCERPAPARRHLPHRPLDVYVPGGTCLTRLDPDLRYLR